MFLIFEGPKLDRAPACHDWGGQIFKVSNWDMRVECVCVLDELCLRHVAFSDGQRVKLVIYCYISVTSCVSGTQSLKLDCPGQTGMSGEEIPGNQRPGCIDLNTEHRRASAAALTQCTGVPLHQPEYHAWACLCNSLSTAHGRASADSVKHFATFCIIHDIICKCFNPLSR